jgi:predicted dehydrogenase
MAVIGVGHLGKEHARILASFPEVELVGVADMNAEQARAIAQRCGTQAFTEYWPLLNLVDAVSIAVPTQYHRDVAREFLRRGIPCMVEKPLASTLEQAEELVSAARESGATLQVGHIERFNPVMLELENRPLQPKFIEGQRLGSFTGRSLDIGVVLDLMIHDLDVVLSLVRSEVKSVDAVGVSIFGGHEDIASARLTFANGCVVNLTASRVSMKPARRMRVYAPEGYVNLDFHQRHATLIQPTETARALRGSLDLRKLDLGQLGMLKDKLFGQYLQIREIDLNAVDQLTLELKDFVRCVQTGLKPKVTGEDGRNAIALASQIIARINTHQWDGTLDGPMGPVDLPLPLGQLFEAEETREERAA